MLLLPSSQVWPSGALFATISAAMFPPAPGRFSITTCCAHASDNFWPSARAMMSLGPPGVNPTTNLGGFSGNASAPPAEKATAKARAAAKTGLMARNHTQESAAHGRASFRMPGFAPPNQDAFRSARFPTDAAAELVHRGRLAKAASGSGRGEDQASFARYDRRDAVWLAPSPGKSGDFLRALARRREGSMRDRQPAHHRYRERRSRKRHARPSRRDRRLAFALADSSGVRSGRSVPGHGRARAGGRRRAPSRRRPRLRRVLPAHAIAERGAVPLGGPFDAQLRADFRGRGGG